MEFVGITKTSIKPVILLWTLKFIYSEKATKFCKISTLLLTVLHTVNNKMEISQNFVAFSEYMNFSDVLFSMNHAVHTYQE